MTQVIITYAPYFEKESRERGATDDQIKAGKRLVELAQQGREDLVKIGEIKITTGNPAFRFWERITGTGSVRASERVIIERFLNEQGDTEVIVHVALPRLSDTYEKDVRELWEKYRTPITSPPTSPT